MEWPVVAGGDRAAVLGVLEHGKLVSNSDHEIAVRGLEREWAARTGARFCVGTASGTAALHLALAALGVGPGDEVIVPSLSFIASGLAPMHLGAVPVFADVDPVTFTIDPAELEARLTPRTAAVMPVHLHGLTADMDAVERIARRRGIAVVEDAAQAHGARYKGRAAGTLGAAAAFSLQATKNLPTCGEGGLITTDDDQVADRVTMMRQFGEVIEDGEPRDYISHVLGWNAKLNPVQAAFATAQLERFDDYEARRQENVRRFLARLEELPGIAVPTEPEGRTHVWHILRFRFSPERAGLDGVTPGAFRRVLRRLLRAEGTPMSRYQLVPLPEQKVFRDRPAGGPGGASERLPEGPWPVAEAVIEDSLTLQKRHLNPGSGPLLQSYADAFEKVWENLGVVATMARDS